jgi:hypothetical protein
VRPLLALALVLIAACRSDRTDAPAGAHDAPSSNALRGPDPLVLRVPRAGGSVRVSAYPALDSVVWRSSEPAPAIQRVLGFDRDVGVITYADSRRIPGRINLALGELGRASRTPLQLPAPGTGAAIFGVTDTTVVRLTPAATWRVRTPSTPRGVYPLRDGSVLILGDREQQSVLWRVRPPGDEITDTVPLPRVASALNVPAAGQLVLTHDGGVSAMSTRTMLPEPAVPVEGEIHGVVATPSADRLFVLAGERRELVIIDRFQRRVERTVTLPAQARALRMDPLGRYVLVRQQDRDSVWIVAIGTGRVLGTLRSAWREDLPFVATDGAVALVQGEDVVFADGETLRDGQRVENGARDFWYFFQWMGFRPRDAALDQPATFPTGMDTLAPVDTLGPAAADSLAGLLPPGTNLGDPEPPAAAPAPAPRAREYLVQIGAVSNEERAKRIAQGINVDGNAAHVMSVPGPDRTVYRVVLGPYRSRAAAEKAGRSSGMSYWILEAAP